ncbi:MAG: hypothetical protein R3Y54_10555 [Eubacteriales bacterium]
MQNNIKYYGLILELKDDDTAIFTNNIFKSQNWLLTDLDSTYNYYHSNKLEYIFVEKKDIYEIIDKNKFKWAVFSGFDEKIQIHEILKSSLPYAFENDSLWLEPISIQNKLAKTEIIVWDFDIIIIISSEKAIIDDFLSANPNSKCLKDYIKQMNM